jgi:hypothetical protein
MLSEVFLLFTFISEFVCFNILMLFSMRLQYANAVFCGFNILMLFSVRLQYSNAVFCGFNILMLFSVASIF